MSQSTDKRIRIVIAASLIAVTVFAYQPVLQNHFIGIYDDGEYVTENLHVQQGLTRDGMVWAFTTFHSANWHPLTWLSHLLDCTLFALNPAGHHLTSLLLHLANALLLFLLLIRMTRAPWQSGLVAAWFAIHPLHVESVAWVAERKDVLSTFFWMLATHAYLAYAARPGILRYAWVSIAFALGLMAKPMVITLPLVLLLLDYWPLGRLKQHRIPKLILEKAPLLLLAVASGIVTVIAQREGGALSTLESVPLGVRAANALVAYVAYILKMLWPARLAAFYPYRGEFLEAWQVAGSFLLFVIITALATLARRLRPAVMVGWLWYLVTLLPVIGLVQVGDQAMADRYTYLPLVGLFILIAWGVSSLPVARPEPREERKRTRSARSPSRVGPPRPRSVEPRLGPPVAAVCAATIVALTTCTRVQVGRWRDSRSLFEHALQVTSQNYLAYTNLGSLAKNDGRVDQAIAYLTTAVAISPNYAPARNILGNALADQGKLDEAIRQYLEVLRDHPRDAEAHNNLGVALARQGKTEEALREFTEALRLKPDYPDAHNNLGNAYDVMGNAAKAIEHFSIALRLNPSYVEAENNLGLALFGQGKIDEAISHWSRAIELKPDYVAPHNNLARAFYHKGNYARAWSELHLSRKYGGTASPDLVQALSLQMPEPKGEP